MSKFIKRQNRLRKAQSKFEKISRHSKHFKVNFERSQNKNGRFRTSAKIFRGEKNYGGRGLIHKTVNLKSRFIGEKPSVTRFIDSFEPSTKKGKLLKKSAQITNFAVHDTAKTAVDAALAGETIGLKSAETSGREVKNHLTQKYSREAVDDYNRGTIFIGRTAIDAIRGTKNHFKSKKQYRLEKAKFKLKKAEFDVFRHDEFKPKIQKNNDDFKSKKSKFREQKKAYKSGNKSNIQRAFFKRHKQDFRQSKSENRLENKRLKADKKFRKKELKNQRKIKNNSKTDFLAVKPVKYSAEKMRASAWQKAVNEDSDNDFLHAIDSAKRRIIEPTAQKLSKPERLHREQKKREKIADKNEKSNKKLNRQQKKLHEKNNNQKHRKKPKNSHKNSFSDSLKNAFKFVKNVYENEVKKFFAVLIIPIIILLIFAFVIMIFTSVLSGGGFVLGTYSAQDYDLSEAEKYYTKLAFDMNENVRKIGTSEWKNALKNFGIDTSNYKDNPDEFIFGKSVHFNYDAVFDFDIYKFWSFLCAYYYDFDSEKSDIKYWKFGDNTRILLDEIFNAEYEFQHFYDNTSHWEYRYNFDSCGYFLIDGSGVTSEFGYINISFPDALPFNYGNDNTIYFDLSNGEILNYNDNFSSTGWYLKNQFVDDYDSSGTKFGAWYTNGETCGYGIWENGVLVTPIPYVIPEANWCSFLKKYDWKTDCRLYYNIRQKKTFDDVIFDKLNSMSHPDERIEYYSLLVGNDSGEMFGNHQTLKNITGAKMSENSVINGFGYDIQNWNEKHCNIENLHEGIDIILNSNSDISAPFDCKITDVNSEENYVVLRKNNVQYWYDDKRDTEIYLSNIVLKDGFKKGDTIKSGEIFATSTSTKKCDKSENNTAYDYVHIKIKIDTDGIGWDFIDPRLVLY